MHPSDEVVAQFGVRLIASLGGRVNQHWLVEAHGEQFVLRCWGQSPLIDDSAGHIESIRYEVRLVASLAALGWPVAPTIAEPTEIDGHIWSLASFLSGEVPLSADPIHGGREEQRIRGRLLAEFHAGLAQVPALGQRPGWRRCEEILADPTLDDVLNKNEQLHSEEVLILRWHLQRARERIAELQPDNWPGSVVHGDFTPWNLRFTNRRLSGILDFELSHWDHRVGDFALSWRGKYDEVILGYAEVSPLKPEEGALIVPLWWAQLIQGACVDMQHGIKSDGWTINKLLLRSPLMGEDSVEYKA
jgi:aminoglycoside phosphotransferase (APT) family kinase protein